MIVSKHQSPVKNVLNKLKRFPTLSYILINFEACDLSSVFPVNSASFNVILPVKSLSMYVLIEYFKSFGSKMMYGVLIVLSNGDLNK
jgi:hypothetical protein